jgi:hypothetical protein
LLAEQANERTMAMLRKGVIGMGCLVVLVVAGCSHNRADSVSPQDLARIPPDQMAPVNQARMEVAKAQDEVSRRDLALKSAEQEVEVAKHEVNVAKTHIDQTQAILNKANFDRNSQVGQQAQRDLATYKAQLDAAQAHLKAAQAAAELARAHKKQADAERELAETRLHLAKALALRRSGDPAGKNVNADSLRAQVDDRLKDVERAKADVAKLQTEAEREHLAWQAATQRYNQVRGVGGSSTR